VNLTITSQLIINFTMDNVSFGSGYVKSGASACVLSTGETAEDTAGCASFNTPGIVHGLLLENIGNEYAEVNLSNRNWSSSMIGGTEPGYAWKWSNVSNDVNVTCEDYNFTGADIIYNTFVNLTSSNYLGENGNDIGKVLCKKLNYTDGSNDINITFKLHIPQNAPARTLDDIWFAFATLAS
ncbi:MAG: hypothetical protein U9Q69_02630, partial [Nanoarchaeota archaeon]|nr:hypothetical protein [Nanoarchaeota archaeon]